MSRQAGPLEKDEIEITPAMINAGVSAYLTFEEGGRNDPPEMVVREIFEAMAKASPNLSAKRG